MRVMPDSPDVYSSFLLFWLPANCLFGSMVRPGFAGIWWRVGWWGCGWVTHEALLTVCRCVGVVCATLGGRGRCHVAAGRAGWLCTRLGRNLTTCSTRLWPPGPGTRGSGEHPGGIVTICR
jgi:hypothetical protein